MEQYTPKNNIELYSYDVDQEHIKPSIKQLLGGVSISLGGCILIYSGTAVILESSMNDNKNMLASAICIISGAVANTTGIMCSKLYFELLKKYNSTKPDLSCNVSNFNFENLDPIEKRKWIINNPPYTRTDSQF